jgi:hypothetical protein
MKSIKNLNDPIGNRTRDLPACSVVPQPTAPPPTPTYIVGYLDWYDPVKYNCLYMVYNLAPTTHKLRNISSNVGVSKRQKLGYINAHCRPWH